MVSPVTAEARGAGFQGKTQDLVSGYPCQRWLVEWPGKREMLAGPCGGLSAIDYSERRYVQAALV